jgi:hypothetical protein
MSSSSSSGDDPPSQQQVHSRMTQSFGSRAIGSVIQALRRELEILRRRRQRTRTSFSTLEDIGRTCGYLSNLAFEHFADQGAELTQVDRVSQQRNIRDQRSLADLSGRLSRQ